MTLTADQKRQLEFVLRFYVEDLTTIRLTEATAYGTGQGPNQSFLHARHRVQDPTARVAELWSRDAALQWARWRVAQVRRVYEEWLDSDLQRLVFFHYWQRPPLHWRGVAQLLHISEPTFWRWRDLTLARFARWLPPEWAQIEQWCQGVGWLYDEVREDESDKSDESATLVSSADEPPASEDSERSDGSPSSGAG